MRVTMLTAVICTLAVVAAGAASAADAVARPAATEPALCPVVEGLEAAPEAVPTGGLGGVQEYSCSATWYCETWWGSRLSCSCPGAGTCTSGPENHGYVSCDCIGAPDTYETCPCFACTSAAICTKPIVCNNPWAVCYHGCCLCD